MGRAEQAGESPPEGFPAIHTRKRSMAAGAHKAQPEGEGVAAGSLSGVVRWALRTLSPAAVYWIAGRLALEMAIPPGYATAVWPAAGFALVGVLVWGFRVAPGIAIGSFFVNVGTSFDASSAVAIATSIAVALGIGMGAALQAVAGALLIRRVAGFPTTLEHERDITRFMILGGPVACIFSPTVGVTTLCAAGITPWANYAFSFWTWWVGDTIGVLIFAPSALMFVARPPVATRRRQAIIGVPLLVGFSLATLLFLRVSAWEETRLSADFERRAAPLPHALEARLAEYEGVVTSIASFFDTSQDISRGEFHDFVQRLLKSYEGIQGLGWNPVVLDAERATYEEAARRDGLPAFQFTEKDVDGVLKRARARAEYVPAYYLEPYEGNESALGYDIGYDPVRLNALKGARDSGLSTATSPITLVQDTGRPLGLLLVVPVFRTRESSVTARDRSRDLRGYAVGVFRIHDVVEAALRGLDRNGMDLQLIDEAASADEQIRYDSRPGEAGSSHSQAKPSSDLLRSSRAFDFGGRRFTLEVKPTIAYMTGQRSWQAWMVLAGGLFFVGLLGVVMLLTTGRTSEVERIAEETAREATRAAQAEARYRDLYDGAPDMYVSVDPETARVVDCNQTAASALGYTKEEIVGRRIFELYHPDRRTDAEQTFRAFVQTGEVHDVELELKRKDGSKIDVSLNASSVRNSEGKILHSRSAWRDITARKQKERDERFLLELTELGSAMSDTEELLFFVVTRVGEYLGVSRCLFAGIDLDNDQMVVYRDYHRGVPSAAGTYSLSAFSPETLGELKAGRIVLNSDARIDPRTASYFETSYRSTGLVSYVTVPLLRDGRWKSVLGTVMDTPRVWSPREVSFLQAVAEKTWNWVERLRLALDLRKLNEELERRVGERTSDLRCSREELRALSARLITAQEDERRRISLELHDDVNQRLAMLTVEAEAMQLELPLPVGQIRERLSTLHERLVALSNDVHRLAYRLHPSMLEHLGLEAALRSHIDDFTNREGIPVALHCRRLPGTLPLPVASCLFRVAQEALRNAALHSRTDRVSVRLLRSNGRVLLSIRDFGCGFAPDGSKGRLGIVGMEERINLAGGSLQIQSRPGRGTRVQAWVPLAEGRS